MSLRLSAVAVVLVAAACTSEQSLVRVGAICNATPEAGAPKVVPFGERLNIRTKGVGPWKKSRLVDSGGVEQGVVDLTCLAPAAPTTNDRWVRTSSASMRSHDPAKNQLFPWGTKLAIASLPGGQGLVVTNGLPQGLVAEESLATEEPTPAAYVDYLGKLDPAMLAAELVAAPDTVMQEPALAQKLPKMLRVLRQSSKVEEVSNVYKRLPSAAFDSEELRREICDATGNKPGDALPIDCDFVGARVLASDRADGECPEGGSRSGDVVTLGDEVSVWACRERGGWHVYGSDANRTWIAVEANGSLVSSVQPRVSEVHALPGKGACIVFDTGAHVAKPGADLVTTLLCGTAPDDTGKIESLRHVVGWTTATEAGEDKKVESKIGWPEDANGFLCLARVMTADAPAADAPVTTVGYRARPGKFEKLDETAGCD